MVSSKYWPLARVEAAGDLVMPGAERIPNQGGSHLMSEHGLFPRRSFYRLVPAAERERIVELAEQFARDIDAAIRLERVFPNGAARLHHLGPVIQLAGDERSLSVYRVTKDGADHVLLRAWLTVEWWGP